MYILNVTMNTDDDAEIYYNGNLYCDYAADLIICKEFKTREDAIKHLAQNVRVILGGKADQFTQDWLQHTIKQFRLGEPVESIYGNQEFEASLEERK